MMSDHFDGGRKYNMISPVINITADVDDDAST